VNLTAIVLAAGLSRRMGAPKMLLPWRGTTVLGQVLQTLKEGGIEDILVVVGANRDAVEEACRAETASYVFNPAFQEGEMLSSLQTGLGAVASNRDAVLVVLGDQPLLEARIVHAIVSAANAMRSELIVPSHSRHRGHPWLLGAAWWEEVDAMRSPATLRDFLRAHAASIQHVEVDTDSILTDLDTPQDYLDLRP